MKRFTTASPMSMRRWLFQSVSIVLALELASFILLGFALKRTVIELAGPYFALAVPSAVMLFVIWRLNQRTARGTSPQKVARSWSLSLVVFFIAVIVAMFYSSATLGLMRPKDALVDIALALLIGIPSIYFAAYRMALIRTKAFRHDT